MGTSTGHEPDRQFNADGTRTAPLIPAPMFELEFGLAWSMWESWAARHSVSSFPAASKDVLALLLDRSIPKGSVYAAWRAIDAAHESVYWDTNRNPVLLLRLSGVRVSEEGKVLVPSEVAMHLLREPES